MQVMTFCSDASDTSLMLFDSTWRTTTLTSIQSAQKIVDPDHILQFCMMMKGEVNRGLLCTQ